MAEIDPNSTQARIIESAKKIIGEVGTNKTSVNAIADAAGLSKGGIYHYYKSKSEILYDILDQNLSESTKIAHELKKGGPEREKINESYVLDKIIERTQKIERNILHLSLMQEAISGDEALFNRFAEKYNEWADRIEDIMVEMYQLPRTPMIRSIAVVLLAIIDGFCIQEILGVELTPPEDLRKLSMHLLLGEIDEIKQELKI